MFSLLLRTRTRMSCLYADSDVDDWPTPDQEASAIGTGEPNNWPLYKGNFQVKVLSFKLRAFRFILRNLIALLLIAGLRFPRKQQALQ